MKISGLALLFVAGALLASVAAAQPGTTTLTETTTTAETTTEPGTTLVTTATVQQTTTRRVLITTTPATTSASSSSGTEAWVWVLLAVLAAIALILAGVLLAGRGRGARGLSVEERRRRLDGAVGSWTIQGWAIESQTADSAVLRRGGELMLVGVDEAGHVSTRPLPNQ
jgi:hypothetical protein